MAPLIVSIMERFMEVSMFMPDDVSIGIGAIVLLSVVVVVVVTESVLVVVSVALSLQATSVPAMAKHINNFFMINCGF